MISEVLVHLQPAGSLIDLQIIPDTWGQRKTTLVSIHTKDIFEHTWNVCIKCSDYFNTTDWNQSYFFSACVLSSEMKDRESLQVEIIWHIKK